MTLLRALLFGLLAAACAAAWTVYSPSLTTSLRLSWPVPASSSALSRLTADAELHQAWADGRRQALTDPGIRQALLAQALSERRLMAADPTLNPELVDLEVSLLEQALQTPPHDRRLQLLLVEILQRAAADPALRQQLLQALTAPQ